MNALLRHTCIAAIAFLTSSVAAQELDDARAGAKQHYARALELLDEAAYEEAIVELQQAYSLRAHYGVLYNLGMAHVALGHPVEARDALTRYLEEGASEVGDARRAVVEQELKRQTSRIGALQVSVSPSQARVLVGNSDVSELARRGPVPLGIGEHAVRFELDGYRSAERRVTISGGQQAEIDVALEPAPKPELDLGDVGQLEASCRVPAVNVFVDDQLVGRTPLPRALVVPAGSRPVRFERDGYRTDQQAVEVRSAEVARVSCRLQPLANLTASDLGQLVLRASESKARVLVDGEAATGALLLPAGSHLVEAQLSGFEPFRATVDIPGGGTRSLGLRLVPTLEYRVEYERRAWRNRRLAVGLTAASAALAGTAVGVKLWNDGRYRDWETEEERIGNAVVEGRLGPESSRRAYADNDALLRSVQTWDHVFVGTVVGASALAASGVALWIIGDAPRRYQDVSLVPSGRGVRLQYLKRF